MRVALIGLPKSGKSTVFSAVTGVAVDPFAPPEPRQAIVPVPDPRLAYLTTLARPKKVIEATMEFVDVPGCSLDDAHGRDLWRRVLPAVRQSEALAVVARDFRNDAVPAYRDRIDPQADVLATWDELIFADLDTVTTRIGRLEASLKKPTKSHEAEKRELTLLQRCREVLEAEQPLSTAITCDAERRQLASFAFLTEKPLVCIVNVSEDRAAEPVPFEVPHAVDTIAISASIEAELARLEDQERSAFMADFGIEVTARDRVIRSCYAAAGMISFLTMGPDEVRAWSVPKGSTAVEAAGRIHTDLARGFIRAETVAYDDLVAHQDEKGARAAGRVRQEGKGYVVQDGDVMTILANA
jgi:hypothetical protein